MAQVWFAPATRPVATGALKVFTAVGGVGLVEMGEEDLFRQDEVSSEPPPHGGGPCGERDVQLADGVGPRSAPSGMSLARILGESISRAARARNAAGGVGFADILVLCGIGLSERRKACEQGVTEVNESLAEGSPERIDATIEK